MFLINADRKIVLLVIICKTKSFCLLPDDHIIINEYNYHIITTDRKHSLALFYTKQFYFLFTNKIVHFTTNIL